MNMPDNDLYNLDRFVRAQEPVYERALAELRSRAKLTHWMWFIFPQFEGLGRSSNSEYYAIKSAEEAQEYLNHPVLGARLLQCAEAVLAINGKSAFDIFGSPDDLKLKSSMTLFSAVTDSPAVFMRVLEKYFAGKRDNATLHLMGGRTS